MTKKYLFLVLIFGSLNMAAQKNTSSLYSGFGLGEIASPGFGQNFALGGATTAVANAQHLNPANPASYSSLINQSVIFDVGISSDFSKYSTSTSSISKQLSNFEYLALGFSPNLWWSGSFGFKPITKIGFELTDTQVTSLLDTIQSVYKKFGGLNKLYIGNSFRFAKYFQVGFNFNYVIGNIDELNHSEFQQGSFLSILEKEETQRIEDYTLDFGVLANLPLPGKNSLTVGATYTPEKNLNAQSYLFTRKFFTSTITVLDTLQNDTSKHQNVIFPETLGLGVALSLQNKFFWTADYQMQQWAKANFENTRNSSQIATGIEFTPDFTSIRYFKQIRYRAGFRYNKSHVLLNGVGIDEQALTLGLGFPLKASGMIANVGVELGQRGTLDNLLIKQEYIKLHISFTMHDRWFIKRKFD